MAEQKKENFRQIMGYLPSDKAYLIEKAVNGREENLCEIRLRAGLPVSLIFTTGREFITVSGRSTCFSSGGLLTVYQDEPEKIFVAMCGYSVHSYADSIAEGFITLRGGCRVGVYGKAVVSEGKIISVRNIKGLNIRIAGEYRDSSKSICERLYKKEVLNTLICGPPSSGKTTLLKDMSRILSDEYNLGVAVVDERNEMSFCDLGKNTDVLTSYPKAKGIEIAVRTLSPQVVICDETGSSEEAEAIKEGLNSGVKFIMSIHCRNAEELIKKPQFICLAESGCTDCCVFIEDKCRIRDIISVKELLNENRCIRCFGNNVCHDRAVCGMEA